MISKSLTRRIALGVFIVATLMLLPLLCYEKHIRSTYVYIYPDNIDSDPAFKFVMQLKTHVILRGNVHTFDCRKYEKDISTWIYVDNRFGKLDSSQFSVTSVYGRTDYPWSLSPHRGYIELSQDSVLISIEFPQKKDGVHITGWTPYQWNGKHPLKADTTIPISDKWTI